MKKIAFILTAMFMALWSVAQENEIKRIPGVGYDPNQQDYTSFNRGVWVAAEFLGGTSCHLKGHNMGVTEFDATVGYRFSQYLKVGVGIGARYYINQGSLRRSDIRWGMPIFATVRGNLMPGQYRHVVPYWGCEVGASVRDGFMFRPTLGMRIGEVRNALTLGLSYMGQDVATYNDKGEKAGKYTSFVCLRLGYEF